MNENVLHISDEDAYNSDVLNKKVSHGEWVLYIRGKLVKKSMNPEELEEQIIDGCLLTQVGAEIPEIGSIGYQPPGKDEDSAKMIEDLLKVVAKQKAELETMKKDLERERARSRVFQRALDGF